MEKRRGIRSLIPTGMLSELEGAVQEVQVDQIVPSRYQPRRRTQEEGMAGLVESIRAHGILQPLLVRRRGGELQLIAGERRLEAAKQAGLQRVPVVVREASDREMLELALVENLQREDINPIDAAEAYARLIKEFTMTQEEVAERVGKSRSTVANSIRLLRLPEVMQESIRQGTLDEGHGKVLAGIADDRARLRLFRRIIRRGLSVRESALLAERLTSGQAGRQRQRPGPALDPNLQDVEYRLRTVLGTQVRIKPKGEGGTIEITYADWIDLDRVQWEIMGGDRRSPPPVRDDGPGEP